MADEQAPAAPTPPYVEVFDAPVICFDLVAANGIMNGAVQIELANRIMTPLAGTGVDIKFVTSGRLRCSPAAAAQLINALQGALEMLQQPQEAQTGKSALN